MRKSKERGMQIAGRYAGHERKNWNKGMEINWNNRMGGIKGNRIRDDMTKGMNGKTLKLLKP